MSSALGVLSALYVVAYLVVRERARRRPARVAVICPLRSGPVPDEISERLGAATGVADVEPFTTAEVTIAYATAARGLSLAPVVDEASLDETLGPLLRRAAFAPSREQLLFALREQKWNASILYGFALEVIHRQRPPSLVVDLRPPRPDDPRGFAVAAVETDVDLGMYAYELLCRLERYSDYRDAIVSILFCGEGGAWLFTRRLRPDESR
jgi:hypothetical protein